MLKRLRSLMLVVFLLAPHIVLFKNQFMSMESAYGRSKAVKSAVRFWTSNRRGGGTGMIYKSMKSRSWILTNAHVCEMMQKHGGIAETYKGDFDVTRVQISEIHDLCVAEVNTNLKINNKISRTAALKGDRVWIVGHPSLLPLIIVEGYVSDRDDIMVNDSSKPCEEADYKNPDTRWECAITGKVSTASSYDSLLTSGLIEPGSSGSPVYNEYGEVVAVVFAGAGSRGQAWCVPWEYVNAFLTQELAEDKFTTL